MSDERQPEGLSGRAADEAARARRLEALRNIARETQPVEAVPAPSLAAAKLPLAAAGTTGATQPPRRRWGAAIAGGLLALVVIAGVTFTIFKPGASARHAAAGLQLNRFLAPSLAKATVYIPSNNGDFSHLYAVNADTGKTVWRFSFGASYTTPLLAGGVVYTASQDGNIYAIQAATGKQIWAYARPDQQDAYLALAGSTLYLDDDAGYAYALDASSGKQIWRHDANGADTFYSAPAVASGLVFASSGCYPTNDGSLYALNAATGALTWQAPVGFAANGMPAVANGAVYVTDNTGDISAYRADNGAKVWGIHLYIALNSGVAIAGSDLYIQGQNGVIYAFNAANGAVVWKVAESGSQGGYLNAVPLIVNGTLYVGSSSG